MFRKPLVALSALIICNVIWASIYTVSKAMMGGAGALSPLALCFWRLAISTAVLFPLAWRVRPRRRLDRREWGGLAVIGFIGTAGAFLTQFAGTKLSLATNASLITALETIINVLLAVAFLGERLSGRMAASLVLAFVGVLLLNDMDWRTLDLFSGRYAFGNLLLLISMGCYAIYTIAGKGVIDRLPPLVVTGYPFLIATLTLGVACWWLEPGAITGALHWSGTVWVGLLFMGLCCTALTYLVWNAVLVTGNVSTMSLTLYVQPVVGALIAWAVLGERLSGNALLGAGAVVAAVVMAAFQSHGAGVPREVTDGVASLSNGG